MGEDMVVLLAKCPTSQCPSHTRENTEALFSPRLSEPVLLLLLTLLTVFMELGLFLVMAQPTMLPLSTMPLQPIMPLLSMQHQLTMPLLSMPHLSMLLLLTLMSLLLTLTPMLLLMTTPNPTSTLLRLVMVLVTLPDLIPLLFLMAVLSMSTTG